MNLEKFEELLKNRKLSEAKTVLKVMNEYDIASLIQELPEDKLIQAFRLLPKDMASDVFVNLDEDVQKNLDRILDLLDADDDVQDVYTNVEE